jgi:hypothetical protein
VEEDRTSGDPRRRLRMKADDGHRRHRLSRSRFADEAESLTGVNRETRAIDGTPHTPFRSKLDV